MLFSNLIHKFKKNISIEIINCSDIYDIQDVMLIDGEQTKYSNHTLYFGYDNQIQNNTIKPPQCILGRTQQSFLSDYYSNIDIAVVDNKQLFSSFNEAKKILNSTRHIGLYKELLELVSETRNIQSLINSAATKLGNSIILLDVNYKVLFHSTIFPITDRFWKENVTKGYCNYEFICAINELDAIKNSPNTPETIDVTCPASSIRKLCSKVFHNGVMIGNVLMLEKETPITPTHMELLRAVSLVTGEALSRYTPYLLPASSHYQQLLYDLLIGAPPDDIASRIEEFPFSSRVLTLCIITTHYWGQKHLKEHALGGIKNLLSGTHFTFHDGCIAALVPLSDSMDISSEQLAQLSALAKKESLRIGISNSFSDIKHFAKYYKQARTALDMDQRFQKNSPICKYIEYTFYDLLDFVKDKSVLGLFCHPALSILREYDYHNKTDLYHTLHVYLEYSCSIKTTAEALFIHRNSLAYRLERIVKITGIDLTDCNTKFLLAMSYQINHFAVLDS